MAERIDIVVTKTGDVAAQQGVAGIGTAAERTGAQVDVMNKSLGFMRTALGALGIGLAVSELIQLSDAYAGIQSRIRLVSKDNDEFARAQKGVSDIAQQTHQSLEGTATLYTKLAQNTASLGITQDQLLGVVRTVNQAIQVSGASSSEASAGLLQFGQAMASGVLQGDELRSILENLPFLAKALADGLGVPIGALRAMGAQGQLTSKMLIDALQKSAPMVAQAASGISLTIGQAITNLQNSFMMLIGTFNSATGLAGLLAQSILFVANNLQTFASTLLVAGSAWATFYVAVFAQNVWTSFIASVRAATSATLLFGGASISAATNVGVMRGVLLVAQAGLIGLRNAALQAWAVIAANPFVAIATAIAAAISYVYFFGDAIFLTSNKSISLLGAMIGIWWTVRDAIAAVASWIMTYLGPAFSWLGSIAMPVLQAIWDIIKGIIESIEKLVGAVGSVGGAFGKMGKTVTGNMEKATTGLKGSTTASGEFGQAMGKTSTQVLKTSTTVGGAAKQTFGSGGGINGDGVVPKALKNTATAMIDLNNTARDSMGNTIKEMTDLERMSGKFFNKTAENASDMAESIKASMASVDQAMATSGSSLSGGSGNSSGSSGGGTDGGGGSSGETTGTFGQVVMPSVAEMMAGFKNQGGNSTALGPLLRNFDQFWGTPLFPGIAKKLSDFLGSQPQGAAKYLAKAVPYLNFGMEQNGLPTFRNGGAFDVGGYGGKDSQLVQFMASPNERVSVETPGQQKARETNSDGSRQIVVQMNITTPDADSFRRSEPQMLMQLGSKLGELAGRFQ